MSKETQMYTNNKTSFSNKERNLQRNFFHCQFLVIFLSGVAFYFFHFPRVSLLVQWSMLSILHLPVQFEEGFPVLYYSSCILFWISPFSFEKRDVLIAHSIGGVTKHISTKSRTFLKSVFARLELNILRQVFRYEDFAGIK